jgi:hypothetical protein
MLRLSVRSPVTGVLLARIVQRKGSTFVLDFGDPGTIADANRRVARGFSLWRMGRLVEARPEDRRMLTYLAEHYASEGMLIALEEPGWAGRDPVEDGELPEDAPTEFIAKDPTAR